MRKKKNTKTLNEDKDKTIFLSKKTLLETKTPSLLKKKKRKNSLHRNTKPLAKKKKTTKPIAKKKHLAKKKKNPAKRTFATTKPQNYLK